MQYEFIDRRDVRVCQTINQREYTPCIRRLQEPTNCIVVATVLSAILIEIGEKKKIAYFFQSEHLSSLFYGFLLSSLMSYFHAVHWQSRCHYRDWEEARASHRIIYFRSFLSLTTNGIEDCCHWTHLRCDNTPLVDSVIAVLFASTNCCHEKKNRISCLHFAGTACRCFDHT